MKKKESCNLEDEPSKKRTFLEVFQRVSTAADNNILTSINKNESKSNPSISPDSLANTRGCDAHDYEMKKKKIGACKSKRLNQNSSKKLVTMRSKRNKIDISIIGNGGHQKMKAENDKSPKLELCKSYLKNCCTSPRECESMHSEFPCPYYYLGLDCEIEKSNKQDSKCKLSHDGPLSKEMQDVLLRHIVHAPKDVLGEHFLEIRSQLTEAAIIKKITDFQQKRTSQSSINWEENNDKKKFSFKKLNFLTKEQFAHLAKFEIYEIDQLWDLTLRQLNDIGFCAKQIEMIFLNLENAKNIDFRSLKSNVNKMKPCYIVSTANSGRVMESPSVLDEREKENHVILDKNKNQEVINYDVLSNKKMCFQTESVNGNKKYQIDSLEYKNKSKDSNSDNVGCKNVSNLLSEEKEIEKAIHNYKNSFGFSPSKSFIEKLRQKKNPFKFTSNRSANEPDQGTAMSVMVFHVQKKNNSVTGSCTNDINESKNKADEEVADYETFCPFSDDINNLLGPNCEEKRKEIIRLTTRYLTEKNKNAKYELKKLVEVKSPFVIKDVVLGSDKIANSQFTAENNHINNYEIVKECNFGTTNDRKNSKENISTDPDHNKYGASDGSLKNESFVSNQNRIINDQVDDVFVQGKVTGDCLLSKESCSFGNPDENDELTKKSVSIREKNLGHTLCNSSSFTLAEGIKSNSSFTQEDSRISDFSKEVNQKYSYVRRTNIESTSITTDQNHPKDPLQRNILKRSTEETNDTSSSLECTASLTERVESCDQVKESGNTIEPFPSPKAEYQQIVYQKLLSDWGFDEDNGPSAFIQTSDSLPSESLNKSSDLIKQRFKITTENSNEIVLDSACSHHKTLSVRSPTQRTENCGSITERFSETEPVIVSPQRLKARKFLKRPDSDEENWNSDQSETEKPASAAISCLTFPSSKPLHSQEESGYGNCPPREEHIDVAVDEKLVNEAIERIESLPSPPPYPKIFTLNDYQPATEIDARMTRPPIPYRLYEILFQSVEVNKPRSNSLFKLSHVTSSDPRLLKREQYFDVGVDDKSVACFSFENNIANNIESIFNFSSMAASTNLSINYNFFNASPILYRYLQKSSWYQTLNSNMKIEINRCISKLVRILNSYHHKPYSQRPTFDLLQIECGGELLEILKNIGIYIDGNGVILKEVNCASAENTRDNMSMPLIDTHSINPSNVPDGLQHQDYSKKFDMVQFYKDSSYNYDVPESSRSYDCGSSEPYKSRSKRGRAGGRGRGFHGSKRY